MQLTTEVETFTSNPPCHGNGVHAWLPGDDWRNRYIVRKCKLTPVLIVLLPENFDVPYEPPCETPRRFKETGTPPSLVRAWTRTPLNTLDGIRKRPPACGSCRHLLPRNFGVRCSDSVGGERG